MLTLETKVDGVASLCLGGLKKIAYLDQAFGLAWRTCLVLM